MNNACFIANFLQLKHLSIIKLTGLLPACSELSPSGKDPLPHYRKADLPCNGYLNSISLARGTEQ